MNSEIEGLGDIIERLTNAVGIPKCGKCEERRKRLNAKFSFNGIKKGKTPVEEPHPVEPKSSGEIGSG